jgi:hypothetical protein
VRRLLTMTALVAFAGPAAACINDSELPGHEREFRSSYQQSDYRPPEPPTHTRAYIVGGTGVLLALVGAGLAIRHRTGR